MLFRNAFLLLASIAMVSIVGCGKAEDDEDNDDGNTPRTGNYYIQIDSDSTHYFLDSSSAYCSFVLKQGCIPYTSVSMTDNQFRLQAAYWVYPPGDTTAGVDSIIDVCAGGNFHHIIEIDLEDKVNNKFYEAAIGMITSEMSPTDTNRFHFDGMRFVNTADATDTITVRAKIFCKD